MTGCCQHHWTRAVADVRRWRQAADRIGSGRQYPGTLAHRPPCSHIVYVPGIFWLPPVDVGQLDRPALLADLRNMPVADVGP